MLKVNHPILVVAALFLAAQPRECLGYDSEPIEDAPIEIPQMDKNEKEKKYVSDIIEPESERCHSNIVDVHFHDAFWFDSAAPLIAEMDASYVSKGLMLSVYGPVAGPFGGDPNEATEKLVQESEGRIMGLASLNTTVPDWGQQGGAELERLATFLAKSGFVGAKFAPPHTCLALNSSIVRDIVKTVSMSPRRVVFSHIGTTPFCGPMGTAILGRPGCCGPEFVDPSYMEDLIQEYTNTSFVLVHAGADFLAPGNEYFYNGANVIESLRLAETYDNVYLEISAFLRTNENHNVDVYPGGNAILQQIKNAGLARKTIYGSDVNQSPNSIASYLSSTIGKMISAGFTKDERCMVLSETATKVFGLDTLVDVPNQEEESNAGSGQRDDSYSKEEGQETSAAILMRISNSAFASIFFPLLVFVL